MRQEEIRRKANVALVSAALTSVLAVGTLLYGIAGGWTLSNAVMVSLCLLAGAIAVWVRWISPPTSRPSSERVQQQGQTQAGR
jgi:hypothetical protein